MTPRPWTARLHLPTLAVAAVLLGVWVLLSWRYGAYVLPSPAQVLAGLAEVVRSGEIWCHTAASLSRILVGFGGVPAYALHSNFGRVVSVRSPLVSPVGDASAVRKVRTVDQLLYASTL